VAYPHRFAPLSLQEDLHSTWREVGARISVGESLPETTRNRTRSHATSTPNGLAFVRVVLQHHIRGLLHSWTPFVGLSRLHDTSTCQKKSLEAFWALEKAELFSRRLDFGSSVSVVRRFGRPHSLLESFASNNLPESFRV